MPGWLSDLGAYLILAVYTGIALFPVVLVLFNSFKTRKAIFTSPWMPPTPATFSLGGYRDRFRAHEFRPVFSSTA